MGDKLKLDPKIPVKWDGFKMTYRYMDTYYDIEVKKDKKESMKVDGKTISGDTFTLKDDKEKHSIILTIK